MGVSYPLRAREPLASEVVTNTLTHGRDARVLDILGRLSSRWGVRDEAVGQTVWFEVQAQTGPR